LSPHVSHRRCEAEDAGQIKPIFSNGPWPSLSISMSIQETLDILGDAQAVADLRQSKEDFASGDTYTAAQVRAELEQRRRLGAQ
jgi:hypothetical protein